MNDPNGPVRLLRPKRFGDSRGWVTETYSLPEFEALGIAFHFPQDNASFSRPPFTLRGLHFQAPPHAQAKLVRCVRGRIWDVAVDIRTGSPSYGRWVGAELSAETGDQLFVPVGFAHGFLTLEPDCEVVYKCSALYTPATQGGVIWNDGDLAVAWPLPPGAEPELSPRDRLLPPFAEFQSPFAYDGHPLTPLA